MLTLPTIVYRCPGQHAGPNGKTYDYLGVDSEDALASALASGWHESLPDACSPPVKAPAAPESVADVPADDAPPTRKELEQKAKELGVSFDGRTSDALLLSRINDALKPKV